MSMRIYQELQNLQIMTNKIKSRKEIINNNIRETTDKKKLTNVFADDEMCLCVFRPETGRWQETQRAPELMALLPVASTATVLTGLTVLLLIISMIVIAHQAATAASLYNNLYRFKMSNQRCLPESEYCSQNSTQTDIEVQEKVLFMILFFLFLHKFHNFDLMDHKQLNDSYNNDYLYYCHSFFCYLFSVFLDTMLVCM